MKTDITLYEFLESRIQKDEELKELLCKNMFFNALYYNLKANFYSDKSVDEKEYILSYIKTVCESQKPLP